MMFERVMRRCGQTLKNKWKGETKGKDLNVSRNNNWELFWFVGLFFFFLGGWPGKMRTGATGICAWCVSGTSEGQSWDLSIA